MGDKLLATDYSKQCSDSPSHESLFLWHSKQQSVSSKFQLYIRGQNKNNDFPHLFLRGVKMKQGIFMEFDDRVCGGGECIGDQYEWQRGTGGWELRGTEAEGRDTRLRSEWQGWGRMSEED